MAGEKGYKLKGKNSAGEIYEIPLAATYDENGNNIPDTYATKDTATTTSDGLMSAEDKTKLDGIDDNANNYSLPLAASGTRGGIQVGYTTSGKNYAVQLSSEKAYVNVPWTDTTYSSGTGISLSGTTINHSNSVTAGSTNVNESRTLAYGESFYVPRVAYDAQGHITETASATLTIPASDNTNYYPTAISCSSGTLTVTMSGTSNLSATIDYATSADKANYIADLGKTTFEAAATAGSVSADVPNSGLSVYEYYSAENSPSTYGNVLKVRGLGGGELALGWSGTDSTTEQVYYRSHRDTSTGGWGNWITLIDNSHDQTIAGTKTFSSTISGSISGNAATATKLATARTIQTNLASTSSASFDGSGNITPGVTGTLPVANGGTGATSLSDVTVGAATNATNVYQSVVSTSASYPVLFSTTSGTAPTAGNKGVGTDSGSLYYNPSTNTLTTGTFSGALSGNATTATTATQVGSSLTLTMNGTTTPVTYNGSAAESLSFYAPTSAGTSGQVLVSNGSGAPNWSLIKLYLHSITLTIAASQGSLKIFVYTSADYSSAFSNWSSLFSAFDGVELPCSGTVGTAGKLVVSIVPSVSASSYTYYYWTSSSTSGFSSATSTASSIYSVSDTVTEIL